MADFLGFAWKVAVILLIIAAAVFAIAKGTEVVNVLKDLTTSRSPDGQWYEYGSTGTWYSPVSLAWPLLQGLVVDDSTQVWPLLVTLLVSIPVLSVALFGLRWLIRAAK